MFSRPCESVETVDVNSSLSTSIRTGPDLREIRARSVTLVVWVAEKSIVWRSSKKSREVKREFEGE